MSVLKQIKKILESSESKKWYETYWLFDIHNTVLKPNYDVDAELKKEDYYPYAEESLKILTEMDHIVMIMWTSSYPDEIVEIERLLSVSGIKFDYIAENPEISSDAGDFGYYKNKFYFNIMFEDKAGFEVEEWKDIYEYLVEFRDGDFKPDPKWSTRKRQIKY